MCSVSGFWKSKFLEVYCNNIEHCSWTREQLSPWAVVRDFSKSSVENMLFGLLVPAPLNLWSSTAKWVDPQLGIHGYKVQNGCGCACREIGAAITQAVTMLLSLSVEDGSRSAATCCVDFWWKKQARRYHGGGVDRRRKKYTNFKLFVPIKC